MSFFTNLLISILTKIKTTHFYLKTVFFKLKPAQLLWSQQHLKLFPTYVTNTSIKFYKTFTNKTTFHQNQNINYFWSTDTYYRITNHYAIMYFTTFYKFFFSSYVILTNFTFLLIHNIKKFKGDGLIFLLSLILVCTIDALISDDEPLFEPVEWSLIQSWILFIFGLSWVAENLICSRFGSYTGRDKRVWISWYKTFWLIEGWYVINFGAAALFVSTPFYNELSYNLTTVVGWWDWYSRIFFFNFISLYSLGLYLAIYVQLNLRYLTWKKVLMYVTIINILLGYLLYTQFLISFFGYWTDPNWYHKSRLVDYIQLSHEPNKWSWGTSKRDHFSYHRSTTSFWFKTDLPMAATFLVFNIFFFFCLFFTYIYWIVLLRRIYATSEVMYTYYTYCVSALRQFFYFFLWLYGFIIFNYVIAYWRLPIEIFWTLNFDSWYENVYYLALTYYKFLF